MIRTSSLSYGLASKAAVVSGLMLVLACLSGCGSSKELDRTRAASLLRDHSKFAAPAYERVDLGRDFRQQDFMKRINWNVVDALLARGYLERRGNANLLTATGEAACKDKFDPQVPEVRWFPMATRELKEVTGITDAPMSSAVPGTLKAVAFTWKWRLTPLGAELVQVNQALASEYEEVHEGAAVCRLYDDGWRVEQVQFL